MSRSVRIGFASARLRLSHAPIVDYKPPRKKKPKRRAAKRKKLAKEGADG